MSRGGHPARSTPTRPDQMRTAASSGRDAGPSDYLGRSELPLMSLLFVLPLIVLYEVGTLWYASDPVAQTEQRIIAFNLMRDFFALFGASGRYLPAMAVIMILLSWHLARNDPWRCSPRTLLGMGLESVAMALPLVAFSVISSSYLPLWAAAAEDWRSLIVLSLGAGVYEELVFRLIAFTLLSLLLIDLLGMGRRPAILLIVVISAGLFSAYHYLGSESFQWHSFIFRTVAGIYFGAIFLLRGFGITSGAHAAYDILIVLWIACRQHSV